MAASEPGEPPRPRCAVCVSVLVPCLRAARFLPECLESVRAAASAAHDSSSSAAQPVRVEICLIDDGSEDGTWEAARRWGTAWEAEERVRGRADRVCIVVEPCPSPAGFGATETARAEAATEPVSAPRPHSGVGGLVRVVLARGPGGFGCGGARNACARLARGEFLCLQDADDVMLPRRIALQLARARARPDALVGGCVVRSPADAQPRYTAFLNETCSGERLFLRQYRECTLAAPTWFFHRRVFVAAGGFVPGAGVPEDALFFHVLLDLSPRALEKVEGEPVVVYRMHDDRASARISRETLLRVRVDALERRVLSHWGAFSVWGAGRDGRRFFAALSPHSRRKVVCFADVDTKKIGGRVALPPAAEDAGSSSSPVPIVPFTEIVAPFIVCVAMDRTGGALERNVASLGLVEGTDYFFFN